MLLPQTFKKNERLCSKTLIKKLFSNGKWFFDYPFKIIWYSVDENNDLKEKHPAQVLFTISKRNFKLAVHRNRLKRLMREGYRKNKYLLYEHLMIKNHKIILAFIYTGKVMTDYHTIEKKINHAIRRLLQDIDKL